MCAIQICRESTERMQRDARIDQLESYLNAAEKRLEMDILATSFVTISRWNEELKLALETNDQETLKSFVKMKSSIQDMLAKTKALLAKYKL